MQLVDTCRTHCPYCGEPIELLVDYSVEAQQYIEDCQVCCRPMSVSVEVTATGEANVWVSHEDE